MADQKPPKALLFDIGGVCVVSPFQAILDYEIENNIPIGYINFSIQKGPHSTGAWQLIERGETELNDAWFAAFRAQLSVPAHWAEYYIKTAAQNAQQDGAVPDIAVDQIPPVPHIDAKKMFWRMMRLSRTPDPWMYPALKKLGDSGKFVMGALSNTVVYPEGVVDDEGVLFDRGLMHPPEPWPYVRDSRDIKDCFDVFVSSAHAGVRKPDRQAYELAVRLMGEKGREVGKLGKGEELGVEDCLMIDDIGANLKGARNCGLRTLKVDLGKTREAVKQLERITGMQLLDEKGEAKARL